MIDTLYNFTDRHTVDYEQIRRKKKKKNWSSEFEPGRCVPKGWKK